MKIDISNDSFNPLQGYTRVLLQQGRPILDRDWNEQTAIVLHQLRAAMRGIYGRHGGPAGGDCGFIPRVEGLDLYLRAGWYSVDGLMLNCNFETKYTPTQRPPDDPIEAGKTYLFYLEVIEREVTAAEEKTLLESALPGVDVAARGQVKWRVRHEEWSDAAGLSSEKRIERANKRLNEMRQKSEAPDVTFPRDKVISALKDLADREPNRLFRLEYHSANTLKISTDNGFPLYEIDKPDSAAGGENTKAFKIRRGALQGWLPKQGNIIELLTIEDVQFNMPGELCTVDKVQDHNDLEATDSLTVPVAEPPASDRDFRFLRVWEDKISVDELGEVKPGDFWQFTSRNNKPAIDGVKLRRPSRVYAPLALVRMESNDASTVINYFQRIVGPQWREVDDLLDL